MDLRLSGWSLMTSLVDGALSWIGGAIHYFAKHIDSRSRRDGSLGAICYLAVGQTDTTSPDRSSNHFRRWYSDVGF